MTALILYPAIDLKDGQCVRLLQGEMATATVYNDNPAAQATAFVDAGCSWLHVVDLNGAFAGRPVNRQAVIDILQTARLRNASVQLGGGIRDLGAIEYWLSLGIARVILGSAAIKNPYLVNEACVRFPGKIVVGIDARDGFVTAEGWAESSTVRATELALRVEDQGANAIIYTDVTRDGMKTGLNLTQTIEVAGNIKIDLIASGGIGSADDLKALALVASQKGKRNIRGVVVGRALYDGSIAVNDALIALRGSK